MEYIVTRREMKQYESNTINEIGIPVMVLMERAALAVVDYLLNSVQFSLSQIAVICGCGNNGGDGVAIARLLKEAGYAVTLFVVGDINLASNEMRQQLSIAAHYQISITALPAHFDHYTTIIDALFGIGLTREITGQYADVIRLINQCTANVLAVDIPSGICADNGKILGIAVMAKTTVTFAYKKVGVLLYPASQFCGQIIVADIGINLSSFYGNLPATFSYQPDDLLDLLPVRFFHSNKGSYGKVLVIAGSKNMSGAAYFAAKSAYKTGAGIVKIFTAKENRENLLAQLPEAIVTTYDSTHLDCSLLTRLLQEASVIVIGPGLGMSVTAETILQETIDHACVPLIIDADALNILAKDRQRLTALKPGTIITPHLGEISRLLQKTIAELSENLIETAKQFSQQYQLNVVLKESRTVVVTTDHRCYLNQSGNNGMSTAGSGDVLTGIIAGLIAQHLPAEQAATLGVYLHGLAGDLASEKRTVYSLMASDIIAALPMLFQRIKAS